jgi:hypothetical protein
MVENVTKYEPRQTGTGGRSTEQTATDQKAFEASLQTVKLQTTPATPPTNEQLVTTFLTGTPTSPLSPQEQLVFNYFNNKGVFGDAEAKAALSSGVLVVTNGVVSIDYGKFYSLAGVTDDFRKIAVDKDGKALTAEQANYFVRTYDAATDSVSSGALQQAKTEGLLIGYTADGKVQIDTSQFYLSNEAYAGSSRAPFVLNDLPKGATATFTFYDPAGVKQSVTVVDGGKNDRNPAEGSVSFNLPSNPAFINGDVPISVVVTDPSGTRLGETLFKQVAGSLVAEPPVGSSSYYIDSSDPSLTFSYKATPANVTFQIIDDKGVLGPSDGLEAAPLQPGILTAFLERAKNSDDPVLQEFYHAYVTLSLREGDVLGDTTLSAASIANLDTDAATQYINDVVNGTIPGFEAVKREYSAAQSEFIAANYTTVSGNGQTYIIYNEDLAAYDESLETKDGQPNLTGILDGFDRRATTVQDFYKASENNSASGYYKDADGAPRSVDNELAALDDPINAIAGPPAATNYNNEYDLSVIAAQINSLPPGRDQEIIELIEDFRPTIFVTGNLSKLTPQQRTDLGQFIRAWAADYSTQTTSVDKDGKIITTASIERTLARYPATAKSVGGFVALLDKIGGIAVLAGAFGIVGGALALSGDSHNKYDQIGGITSIVGSTQYANKYGNAVAAFTDRFFSENLGATRLDRYISYGATFGQQVGGLGSSKFLKDLPATLQEVNKKIDEAYARIALQNPANTHAQNLQAAVNEVKGTFTTNNVDVNIKDVVARIEKKNPTNTPQQNWDAAVAEVKKKFNSSEFNLNFDAAHTRIAAANSNNTPEQNIQAALDETKKTFKSPSIDIPVQYGKYFDRLSSLVSQIDNIPAGITPLDLLAKLTGSASTDRGFALTLAAIENGLGDETFGVTFKGLNDTQFQEILTKNNIRLTAPQLSALKELVAASEDYKTAVSYAARDSSEGLALTTVDNTRLTDALTNVNKEFGVVATADDIAKQNKTLTALNTTFTEADTAFIARASLFAKAFGSAAFVATGILGVALGVIGLTNVIKDGNGVTGKETLVIFESAASIVSGLASILAGLAAFGLLPAAAFPPALIIAGLFGALGLVFPALNLILYGRAPDIYGAVDIYKTLDSYGFVKPGGVDAIKEETEKQLEDNYPDRGGIYGGS